MSTTELLLWANNSVYQVGRNLSEYEENMDEIHLLEAEGSASILQELLKELQERNHGSNRSS
mgnify:FL=1